MKQKQIKNNQLWIGVVAILIGTLISYNCIAASTFISSKSRELLKTQQEEIIAVHYPPPSFAVLSFGKIMVAGLFGVVGGVAAGISAISEGNKVKAEHQLEDPAFEVEKQFSSSLSTDGNIGGSVRVVEEVFPSDRYIKNLKRQFGSGLLIDFKTTDWGVIYYLSASDHYRLAYSLRARLMNMNDSKKLWEGNCHYLEDEASESRPTLEELKANDGELLKQKLHQAADFCSRDLKDQFLNKKLAKKIRD
jgi:hypothetical protein